MKKYKLTSVDTFGCQTERTRMCEDIMDAIGISLAAGGDFGAANCQYIMNLNRSTKLELTTLPPLAANECYRFGLHCQNE